MPLRKKISPRTYNLGVNSFIAKPTTFKLLVDIMNILGEYWFGIVEHPPEKVKDKLCKTIMEKVFAGSGK